MRPNRRAKADSVKTLYVLRDCPRKCVSRNDAKAIPRKLDASRKSEIGNRKSE
jgi:hypothetical protein